MKLLSLFNGERIVPPRAYVGGCDRIRPMDLPRVEALAQHLETLVRVCQVPGTPFTGRLWPRVWQ